MTTLLDLKSSVMRQVQRSQSLRSRREPPPPTVGSPLTQSPEPLPRRISGESLEFFGRMNAILQKQENMMRAAQVEVTHTRFPPLHLLHASNMYSLCHERTSAVSRPTTAAAMTSVDRRSGLNGELGGPRAQL